MSQPTQQDLDPERAAAVTNPPKWVRPMRDRVVHRPGGLLIWRVIIAVLGLAVVLAGVALLPLPGPGWAIIFGGLAIWATEFGWAQRLLMWARRQLAISTAWMLARPLPLRLLIAVVGLAILGLLLYGSWYLLS